MNKSKSFKVLLINISLRPESKNYVFPIGLGYITTAIKNANIKLEILDLDTLRISDDEIEELLSKKDYDVVAMGCIVTGYKYVKKYCKMIKKYKNIPIIIGNSVATSIPEILMNKTEADIGVIGEGDITIVELLETLRDNKKLDDVKGIFFKRNNKIIYTPQREVIKNIDNLPIINYDLFDIEFYIEKGKMSVPEPYPMKFEDIRALPLNTARGCPFSCTFCYHVFKEVKYRQRSVNHIGDEIKFLKNKYNINYILFWDELSISTKKRANEIADYFISEKLNINWIGDCRAGLFKDNEEDLALAKKLKKAGCIALGFSLENADDTILAAMNKHITVDGYKEQTRVLQKAGLFTPTSLVIGFPQESLESIKKTFDVCYECNVYPSTGYLLPQPGTEIYDYALKNGNISDEEEYLLNMGDRQDFHINLTNYTQKEIETLVVENLKKIADKLNLGLSDKNLIKTKHIRLGSEE